MNRSLFRSLILLCASCVCMHAQTANEVAAGKQLVAKSLEVRAQITNPSGPTEPFKIMGNLYFAGVNNGEIYLLTSPQGHIMFGAGYATAI